MLAIIRLLLLAIAFASVSVIACIYCLFKPFHPNNVYIFARIVSKFSWIVGLKVELRNVPDFNTLKPSVYICNHQNNYDIFTAAAAVVPNTVSVGKKSLKWIPFFGQMYWLTGNILIDRNNTNRANGTIELTARKIKEKNLSVFLFPEGTRSKGRGLLPFKTGAFRTAIKANVPIVPVCTSNMHGDVSLHNWSNGKVIVEFLDPIDVSKINDGNIREISNSVHSLMSDKIAQLDAENQK